MLFDHTCPLHQSSTKAPHRISDQREARKHPAWIGQHGCRFNDFPLTVPASQQAATVPALGEGSAAGRARNALDHYDPAMERLKSGD